MPAIVLRATAKMAVSNRHRCNSVERLTPFVATKIHAQDTTEQGADACVSFQGHSAVTCAVVDVAVQQCFQCSSQCQSLNFWTCWAAASFASEKGCPPWASASHGDMLQENKGISPLIFISFVQRMFQSSNLSLESSAKGLTTCRRLELTCDVRLAAGKGLVSIVAQWWSSSPQNEAAAMASNTADQWQAWQFPSWSVRGELEVP